MSGPGAPAPVTNRGRSPKFRVPRPRGVPEITLVVQAVGPPPPFVGAEPDTGIATGSLGGVGAGGDTDASERPQHLLPVRRGKPARARQPPVRPVAARARACVPQIEAANDPKRAVEPAPLAVAAPGQPETARGLAPVTVRAPTPGAKTASAFALLVPAIAVVGRRPSSEPFPGRPALVLSSAPSRVRNMGVRNTRQILELRRRPPPGRGREMETCVLRVTCRGNAFAGVMHIRMPEEKRQVCPELAARIEAMVVNTASYAEPKGRANTGGAVFERPPRAPLGGAAAQETVGSGRQIGRPTPP